MPRVILTDTITDYKKRQTEGFLMYLFIIAFIFFGVYLISTGSQTIGIILIILGLVFLLAHWLGGKRNEKQYL